MQPRSASPRVRRSSSFSPGRCTGRTTIRSASSQLEQALRGQAAVRSVPERPAWRGFTSMTCRRDRRGARLGPDRRVVLACGRSACACATRSAIAARVGGRRPPRLTMPTTLDQGHSAAQRSVGGLPGLPANLARRSVRRNVTYWANHDKATAELGFQPRPLDRGSPTRGARASTRPSVAEANPTARRRLKAVCGGRVTSVGRELPMFQPPAAPGRAWWARATDDCHGRRLVH